MWNLLAFLNKRLVLAIPVSMLAGVGFGLAISPRFLVHLIVPMTFVMVYPMMATLRLKNLLYWNDGKTQLVTQALNFGVIPFIALGLGSVFFPEKPLYALGLFLASLLPTSGMTISWTGFAKGNLEAAVKMTVLGLTLGSVVTPFYLKAFMGETMHFEMLSVMRQIALVVFVPMILGHITRQYFIRKVGEKEFKQRLAPRFSGLSTIGVLGIVFISMALKAKSLAESPTDLFYICGPVLLLYAVNYTLSTLTGKLLLPRGDAIALVYGSVMRNLSIALAVALNSFGEHGPEIALVITVAFIIQVQSAAWYVRYTDRIFGHSTI